MVQHALTVRGEKQPSYITDAPALMFYADVRGYDDAWCWFYFVLKGTAPGYWMEAGAGDFFLPST